MKFDELQRDIVYRIIKGNDTFQVGELVWISSSSPRIHLNSVQQAACLDADEIPAGVAGLEFAPQFNWRVETKRGLGGYSRAIKESDDRVVVVSIHKKHLDNILAGKKTIEVRTNWPKAISLPFALVLYETGNSGGSKRIRARATCRNIHKLEDSDVCLQKSSFHTFSQKACLSESEISNYMARHTALYGWQLENVCPLDCRLEDAGLKRAPQSWCYANI